MYKRISLLSLLVFVISFLVSSSLFAGYEDTNGGVYKFECILVAFSISYDNGSTWTTVFDYTTEYEADPTDSSIPKVDIASGDDPGTQIGDYMTDAVIPVGTITHFKPKFPNGTDVFKGWKKRTSDDAIFYSTATGFSQWTGSGTPTESDCADYTLTADPQQGDYMESTDEVSIVVTDGAIINISIQFDLSDAFEVQSNGDITPSDNFTPTITQI